MFVWDIGRLCVSEKVGHYSIRCRRGLLFRMCRAVMTVSHIGFGRARAALCIEDKIMLMGCCAIMLHSYITWNMGCSVSSGKVVISAIRIKIAVGPARSVERGEGDREWKKRPMDCVLVVGARALLLWYTILMRRSLS